MIIKDTTKFISILALVIAFITLLFGNNIIGRVFSSDEKKDNKHGVSPYNNNTNKNDSLHDSTVANSVSEKIINTDDEIIVEDTSSLFIAKNFIQTQGSFVKINDLIADKSYEKVKFILSIIEEEQQSNKIKSKLLELRKTLKLIEKYELDYVFFDNKNSNLFLTFKDDKVGLIDTNGKEIYKPIFDDIDLTHFAPLIMTSKNNKLGFIDINGKEIYKPMFDDIDPTYFAPLIMVSKNDKFGFISREGKEIHKPIFDDIDPTHFAPLIMVSKNDKFGFISREGKELYEPIFDDINPTYFPPLIIVIKEGKHGFINRNGKLVVGITINDLNKQSEKLMRFKQNNKWGLIDSLGNKLLTAKYDSISEFNKEGISIATLGNEVFLIDTDGKISKK